MIEIYIVIVYSNDELHQFYLKDFKTGDIEYTNEILSFSFDIERCVNTLNQPTKYTKVDLGKNIAHLFL